MLNWRHYAFHILLSLLAVTPAFADVERDAYGNPIYTNNSSSKSSNSLQSGTQSTTLQAGTQSTTLQAGTGSTMLQVGTSSTMLQAGTGSTMLQTGAGSTLLQAGVQRKSEPANVLILFDSSTTMKLNLDGTTGSEPEERLKAAKDSLRKTLEIIPADVKVGLRVFGNSLLRTDGLGVNDCKQTLLLVPIGCGNRGEMLAKANELHPRGMTPLMYTLLQCRHDFEGLAGSRHIILISDGFDTCHGDPCAAIRELTRRGYKMRIDIVGMGVKTDKIAKEQLECIAKESGGKYFDADTAAELAKHMQDSAREAIAEHVSDQKVAGQIMPKPAELKAAPADQLILTK